MASEEGPLRIEDLTLDKGEYVFWIVQAAGLPVRARKEGRLGAAGGSCGRKSVFFGLICQLRPVPALLHPIDWSGQGTFSPAMQHPGLESILSFPPSQSSATPSEVSFAFSGILQQLKPLSMGWGKSCGHFSMAGTFVF